MKTLVNPLLIILFLEIVGLWLLKKQTVRPWKFLIWGLIGLNGILTVISLPVTAQFIEQCMTVGEHQEISISPRYIFVLGGGYLVADNPEEDILTIESQRRVLRGISVWKKYPSAKLVFSGASHSRNNKRLPERHARLMADLAQRHGIPLRVILLEPHSKNTAEHPVEALKLPGVTSSTPIAIVTNNWHMRRAMREFRRYFDQVIPISVPSSLLSGEWSDWIPNPDSLADSTTYIREWVGMVWYSIKAMSIWHTRQYRI